MLLLHYQHVATWPKDTMRWQDGLLEAKSKKALIGHGASVHGLPALRQFPGNKWLEIAMIRMNHNGTKMDAEDYNTRGAGNVSEVVTHVKQVRTEGMGVISMKLVGEGAFTTREDRQAAMKYAFRNAGVDSVTVGYKSPAEDEARENLPETRPRHHIKTGGGGPDAAASRASEADSPQDLTESRMFTHPIEQRIHAQIDNVEYLASTAISSSRRTSSDLPNFINTLLD